MDKDKIYLLRLNCKDQVGIVSKISTLLANKNCNIIESKQFTDQDTNSFFIRQIFQLPNELGIETINKKFKNFPNWDKNMVKNSEYIALFPNVMIGLHIDHFYIFWLEPITINKTKEHMQMYYVGNESANGEELKELRKENVRFWKDVMLEDVSAIEGMQEGRNSPVYNGGNFSPVMDQPTHQFHKWIANSLL